MERWADIAGFEGLYQVSDLGAVRRADGLMMTASTPRHRREYPSVYLRRGSERKRLSVHRLMLIAFVGPPPFEGAEARHLDGNHVNNRLTNLAWGSRKDNAADKQRHGSMARGESHGMFGGGNFGPKNGNYRVTPEMKARACDLLRQGYTQRQAAEAVGISQKAVWAAARASEQPK